MLHHAAYRHSPLDRPLRISLNAPLAFDASVQQLVMLTQGHTLYVIPHDIRGDGAAFLAFIRRNQLDQFDCVPSQLKLLLEAGLLERNEWTPSVVFPRRRGDRRGDVGETCRRAGHGLLQYVRPDRMCRGLRRQFQRRGARAGDNRPAGG